MARGNLGLFRRLEESFWLELGSEIVQVKLTEIGGKMPTGWARMVISAPSEVRIHREETWIGAEAPVRRPSLFSPQKAIYAAMLEAANCRVPTTGGDRVDMVKIGNLCNALMRDLEAMGVRVSNRDKAGR